MRAKTVIGVIGLIAMCAAPTIAEAATSSTQYVETVHGWVSVHSQAKLSSPILGRLQLGQDAPLVAKANSWWYEIQWHGKDVYITTNRSYTKVVTDSSAPTSSGTTSTSTSSSSSSSTSSASSSTSEPSWQVQADHLITVAKTQLGAPYYWGHQVPIGSVSSGQPYGFDCSNFVAWSYRTALGISFSGASRYQRYNVGTPVALSDIREGDLLFFATSGNSTGSGHVGMYMGNGMVIQEGGGWGKVTIEPLQGTWLGRNLVFARRVIQ